MTIASHRKHKNFDIIKFKDMYHINAIESSRFSLRLQKDLTDLDEGEFYYHEIIGLDVYENDQLISQMEVLQQVPMMSGSLSTKENAIFFLPYIPPVVLNIPGNRVDEYLRKVRR